MILNYILIALYILLWVFDGIVFIGIVLTWIPGLLNTKVGSLFYNLSNWLLYPFRGLLVIGFIDFSPIIGLLGYHFIMNIIRGLII